MVTYRSRVVPRQAALLEEEEEEKGKLKQFELCLNESISKMAL
jgi:hypothetical protein